MTTITTLETIRRDIANTEALALVAAMDATIEITSNGAYVRLPDGAYGYSPDGVAEAARTLAGHIAHRRLAPPPPLA